MAREPITIVEIDVDFCTRTYGVGLCTAALSALMPAKCFNTFATCKVPTVFNKGVKTLRFAEARPNLPKGGPVYFPALLSVSSFSATVNIAGADSRMSAMGRRATVSVDLADFPYHDFETDPYRNGRKSGTAQFSGVGYDPTTRGTFFSRLKARWPYYTGRPLRVIQAELSGGAIINATTRSYVITGMFGPDDKGQMRIEAQDILALADNEKSVCPKAGAGRLSTDMAVGDTSATLLPVGVGAQYSAWGRAVIGSELMDFTRIGDVVTFTARAVSGTAAASHNAGDVFQPTYSLDGVRLDLALADLLINFAGVPASWVPTAAWAAEVTRWAPNILLKCDICAPTGVSKLATELAVLGVSIWPDPVSATIGLKINRPPDGEAITTLTDRDHIKALSIDDRAEDRLTEVYFYSVQIDPTKGAEDPANYRRMTATFDTDAKGPNAYGDSRIRRIFCRWLNAGDDADVSILSRRLLNRFRLAPVQVKIRLDAKDAGIDLTSVLAVQSGQITDDTGAVVATPMQVISRSEPKAGHEIEIVAQSYQFNGRYGYATQNTCPTYAAASDAQRARGCFAVNDATLKFGDGTGPYKAI